MRWKSSKGCCLILLACFIVTNLVCLLWSFYKNPRHAGQGGMRTSPSRSRLDNQNPYYPQARYNPYHEWSDSSLKSLRQLREQNTQKWAIESDIPSGDNPITRPTEHLLDYLKLPIRANSYEFSRCRMSNCFDFSRCRHEGPIKVHIVPSWNKKSGDSHSSYSESGLIYQNILRIISESKYYESNPQKACIFVLEDDTLDRDSLSQGFQPDLLSIFDRSNNYGMNYLVFNLYSGSWPDYKDDDFSGLQLGAAIKAKASNSISKHRPGFDISLPLFSYQHPYSDEDIETSSSEFSETQVESNRSYFLTFKGKRYVFGTGSDTRNNLYHLNNNRDVIMLTTCRHGKSWHDSRDSRCRQDELDYEKYDFVDLMKRSTFCLTPRGRRLGSFRHLEALSWGCIPVILSDGYVKPFDEIIDWSLASVQFDERLLMLVPDMLRDIDGHQASRMRANCLSIYKKYFSTTKRIILTTLELLNARVKNQISLIYRNNL